MVYGSSFEISFDDGLLHERHEFLRLDGGQYSDHEALVGVAVLQVVWQVSRNNVISSGKFKASILGQALIARNMDAPSICQQNEPKECERSM